MVKSTIDGIESIDSINIEDIPTDKLKKIIEHIDSVIKKEQKDKLAILMVLKSRGEKDLPIE